MLPTLEKLRDGLRNLLCKKQLAPRIVRLWVQVRVLTLSTLMQSYLPTEYLWWQDAECFEYLHSISRWSIIKFEKKAITCDV